ncbi:hypothetical protein J8281_00355 [Aquimarina sp. U1-2]|uniref:hypothetical protein n=1 Tax=Aquimarina sp. U1-2 TaxID=2823141 RepID=UPI001AECFFEE|nr:hypothetical protein [Aquimarina sp. U1-2]MBP2830620.1 hypothetical protein [Aquimarina sp. U1-2]
MKKLTILLAISIALFSCEAESADEQSFSPEVNPIDNPDVEPGKIIDNYNETDGGLNN